MAEAGPPSMARSLSSAIIQEKDKPVLLGSLAVVADSSAATPAAEEDVQPEASTTNNQDQEDKEDTEEDARSPLDVVILYPHGVYIVVSKGRHISEKFHWAIIVAHTSSQCILYHRVFDGSQWTLHIEHRQNISEDHNVIALLKVGEVPEVTPPWTEAIQECIVSTQVPRGAMGAMNCRTFALTAAYELGNSGFTNQVPSWNKVRDIERQAVQYAGHSEFLKRRLVACCK